MGLKSVAALVIAGALATPACGQAPAPTGGEALYVARCKECHESGDERAPTREQLAARTSAEIVTALATGPMAPMAEGLSANERQAIAVWLTTKR